jgi:hypothetical protein
MRIYIFLLNILAKGKLGHRLVIMLTKRPLFAQNVAHFSPNKKAP